MGQDVLVMSLLTLFGFCCCFLSGCQDFNKVLETLRVAKRHLGEILSAFEFFDGESMKVGSTLVLISVHVVYVLVGFYFVCV